MARMTITVEVEVSSERALLAEGRWQARLNGMRPEAIETVGDALTEMLNFNASPLDAGFEIISKSVEASSAPKPGR